MSEHVKKARADMMFAFWGMIFFLAIFAGSVAFIHFYPGLARTYPTLSLWGVLLFATGTLAFIFRFYWTGKHLNRINPPQGKPQRPARTKPPIQEKSPQRRKPGKGFVVTLKKD